MSGRFARISERMVRCRDMSASDWRVLGCISLHADALGQAYPGMTTIAQMTGVRRKDVPRVIRRLEQFRALLCYPGAGPGGVNLYILLLDDQMVSAALRTVRKDADGGRPQDCGQGVRNDAAKVSARVRTKQTIEQTIEQTNEHIRAGNDESTDWFERFWRAYPDRGDQTRPKKPAKEKFALAVKGGVDPAAIIRGAENYGRVMARYQGEDRRYVKQPANWISQRLWEQYQSAPSTERSRFGGMV